MSEYYWSPLNSILDSLIYNYCNDPARQLNGVIEAVTESANGKQQKPWFVEADIFKILISQMYDPALLPESIMDAGYLRFIRRLAEIIRLGQSKRIFLCDLRPSLLAEILMITLQNLLLQNRLESCSAILQNDELSKIAGQLLGMKRSNNPPLYLVV